MTFKTESSLSLDSKIQRLSMELSDTGDEVASYIENLSEAIADWDPELVDECLVELDVIVDEAREDSRRAAFELGGIHKALTSGLRSGHRSAGRTPRQAAGRPPAGLVEQPVALTVQLLEEMHPLPYMAEAGAVGEIMNARTAEVVDFLEALAQWVEDQTNYTLEDVGANSLHTVFAQAHRMATQATAAWVESVVNPFPAYTRMKRGVNPPQFLIERARVDRIVAKVAADRARRAAGSNAAG